MKILKSGKECGVVAHEPRATCHNKVTFTKREHFLKSSAFQDLTGIVSYSLKTVVLEIKVYHFGRNCSNYLL